MIEGAATLVNPPELSLKKENKKRIKGLTYSRRASYLKSQSKSIYICHGHIAVIIKSLQLSIRSFKIKQVLLRKNKQTKKKPTKTILTPFLNRLSGGCRRGGVPYPLYLW